MPFVRLVPIAFFCTLTALSAAANSIQDRTTQMPPLLIQKDIPTDHIQDPESVLSKQKYSLSHLPTDDNSIQMLTTIHAAPTQNFFAIQQQRFSRFLQNLRAICNS